MEGLDEETVDSWAAEISVELGPLDDDDASLVPADLVHRIRDRTHIFLENVEKLSCRPGMEAELSRVLHLVRQMESIIDDLSTSSVGDSTPSQEEAASSGGGC